MIPTKPQLSQLTVKFNKAPANSSVVQTVNDLVTIPHKYSGMLVWVLDAKKLYFLIDNRDGSSITDWEILGNTFTFTGWDSQRVYYQYTCIYYNQSLYMAIQDVPEGIPPTDVNYWEQIAGDNYHFEVPFTNLTQVTFDISIVNPIITVYKKNQDDFYEHILCDIIQINNSPNRWTVKFFEGNLPLSLSGIIIIK